MRKALLLITLVVLLAVPFVNAGELVYYPDREAFQSFLSSNSTYRVVPGGDDWARGWAYYVDERLSTIKGHGDGTIVLVGNVYNNEVMARIWNQTDLPPEKSLEPGIIVLDGYVLITGSEDNIYLTERAFEGLWNPPLGSLVTVALLAMLILFSFLFFLSADDSHAGSFYILAVSLFFLWYLTAERPRLTEGFLRYLLQALKFTAGGFPNSPLAAIMGLVFRAVPPIEENIVFTHWLLILLIISFSFYVAPKRSRELGFIVFGLTFVAPMFRESLYHVTGSALGLAAFMVTLAIISNVTFSPEKWKALLQTTVLSLFTLLAIAINPYLVAIPLIFVLAFPKRYLRNYTYLLLTAGGSVLMYAFFGVPPYLPTELPPNAPAMAERLLLNSALAVVTIVYAVGHRRSIKMKGQTAFLLLMVLVYLPLAFFVPSLFPYCFVLLSGLVVRLIHSLTPGT